jgi:trehalose synthase
MFKSTPVVASAVGGISDQIVDGESGLLVQRPTDGAEFGAAVTRLLGDDELADRIGKAGHRRVVERFLPDTALEQWMALLVSVLDADAASQQ